MIAFQGARLDGDSSIFYCIVCGPVLLEEFEGGSVTHYKPLDHGDMTFDEEDFPQ